MAINDFAVNQAQINASPEIQAGSGAIIAFNQNVIYNYTGSGSTIVIHQNVTVTSSGAIINICQDVGA